MRRKNTTHQYLYPVVIEPLDKEALQNLQEAAMMVLESMQEHGEPIPIEVPESQINPPAPFTKGERKPESRTL